MKNLKFKDVSRRKFILRAGSTAGALAMSSWSVVGGPGSPEPAHWTMPTALLGRTGERVSRLGVGCAQFQLEDCGVEEVRAVLHRALELGINYLDVAPNYGNSRTGYSEEKMGPTIPEIRDRVFLATKTEEPTYEGTWSLLRRSLKRLRTDRIDLVHLHNLGLEPRFPELKEVFSDRGALGALLEARKQGVIRFIGASGHLYPSRFHAALDTGEFDVFMNAVNFVNQHTYDFEHKVWARAARENLGLVAMKVLGGGMADGCRLPREYYERAIRYALSIPGLSCAVIGLKDLHELETAARTVATARPLSEAEAHALAMEGLKLAGTSDWRQAYGTPLT